MEDLTDFPQMFKIITIGLIIIILIVIIIKSGLVSELVSNAKDFVVFE